MPTTTSPVAQIPRSGIRMLMELALRDPEAIRLEVGEPDTTTPQHVIAAAAQDALAGHTGYTSSVGSAELRAALAEKVTRVNGRPTTSDEVLVTHGARTVCSAIARPCIAPCVTSTSSAVVGRPLTRVTFSASAARSSAEPTLEV